MTYVISSLYQVVVDFIWGFQWERIKPHVVRELTADGGDRMFIRSPGMDGVMLRLHKNPREALESIGFVHHKDIGNYSEYFIDHEDILKIIKGKK